MTLPQLECSLKHYMPVRVAALIKPWNFPGILVFENHKIEECSLLISSRCGEGSECFSEHPMITYTELINSDVVFNNTAHVSQREGDIVMKIVHRDTRTWMARVSAFDQRRLRGKDRQCGTSAEPSRNEGKVSISVDDDASSPLRVGPPRDYESEGEEGYNLCLLPEARPRTYEAADGIEPYPVPEPPGLLLLEPLLLVQDVREETKRSRRRKEQLSPSDQQKVARIMIAYTLAFFLLAILTFYVVYFV